MAAAVQPRDHFSRLPTEMKLEIFHQIPDASSVHNLSLASKGFRGILKKHCSAIARTLINRLVPPECKKLVVMAIKSRSDDICEDSNMQDFFDQFMNRNELRDDQYDFEVANDIPSLHHAIVTLQNQGLNSERLNRHGHDDMKIDPAIDPMRLVQTYHILPDLLQPLPRPDRANR